MAGPRRNTATGLGLTYRLAINEWRTKLIHTCIFKKKIGLDCIETWTMDQLSTISLVDVVNPKTPSPTNSLSVQKSNSAQKAEGWGWH